MMTEISIKLLRQNVFGTRRSPGSVWALRAKFRIWSAGKEPLERWRQVKPTGLSVIPRRSSSASRKNQPRCYSRRTCFKSAGQLSLAFLLNSSTLIPIMKPSYAKLFVSSLILLGSVAASAAEPAKAEKSPPRITAEFVEPDKFTDFRDGMMETEKGVAHLMDQFKEHLASLSQHVPEGQRVEIRFTDIDLAGDYEPWRGPQFSDIRIMKEIYAPRMKFDFKVIDAASGAVLRQGSERISDMSYLMNSARIPNTDPLRYDKDLFTDWVRRELRKAK